MKHLGLEVNLDPNSTREISAEELAEVDLATMNATLLDESSGVPRPRVLPAAEYLKFPHKHLMVWGTKHAFYGFPTLELVEYLRALIGDRRAIEVGGGSGVFGAALGIPSTDSMVQKSLVSLYHGMQTPTVKYGPNVEFLEASDAVRKYDPDIVVASWVTQRVTGFDVAAGHRGFADGVEFWDMIRGGRTFVLVGNEVTHGKSKMLSKKHEKLSFPWLLSKSMHPTKNRVYVWRGKR